MRPNWDGGNPRPNPPIHQKGLVTLRRRAQAGVRRRPADLPRDAADRAGAGELGGAGRPAGHRPATISRRPWPRKPTKLALTPREPGSSRATRRLRREGRVPGVLYGGGGDPVAFEVDARELRHALAARGAVLELAIGGDTTPAVLKDAHYHPVRGDDAARRPPARPPRRRDPARPSSLDLIGAEEAPGVDRGRRARAGHARAQHRGAPERHPRVDPVRRLEHGRSATP